MADDIAENDEAVVLELSGGRGFDAIGYVLGTRRHTITIPANENTIVFSRTADTLVEGTARHMLAVNLSNPAPSEVRVRMDIAKVGNPGANYLDDIGFTSAMPTAWNSVNDNLTILA